MPFSENQKPRPVKPPRLKPGDRVGIIAPAGPVRVSELKHDLAFLRSTGLSLHIAPHLYDRHGYLSGDDEARLSDLHAMFMDREITAIFCARGGYGSLRLLDKIDYDLIMENPKIIVGYSDVTALLMAIHTKTGLITFHGPMVRGLFSIYESSWENLFRLISSERPLSFNPMEGNSLMAGRAKGHLMGGNLTLICHLVGTPFLPSLDGCILFIEDKREAIYRLDRMLTHLSLAGKLKGIVGLIGGEFSECGDSAAIDRLFQDLLSHLKIPVTTAFPLGHGLKNLALPIGIPAQLDADLMTLSILEPCVS